MTESEWLASDDPQRMLEWIIEGTLGQSREMPFWPARPSGRKLRLFACACCWQVWHLLTDERSRKAVEVAELYADGESDTGELYIAHRNAQRAWETTDNLAGLACYVSTNSIQDAVSHITRAYLVDMPPPAVQAVLLRDIVGNPFRPWPRRPAAAPEDWDAELSLMEWRRWQGGIVVKLAQAAYDERPGWRCQKCKGTGEVVPGGSGRFDPWELRCDNCRGSGRIEDGALNPERLLVLADALEEAGCEDEDILRHLRGRVRCPECLGSRIVLWDAGTGQVCTVCHEVGWLRTDAPHVCGCWVLDLLLGKE